MYDHRKSVHVPETDFNLFRAGGSASRQIEICIFYLITPPPGTEQIEICQAPETDFNLFRARGYASKQIEICIYLLSTSQVDVITATTARASTLPSLILTFIPTTVTTTPPPPPPLPPHRRHLCCHSHCLRRRLDELQHGDRWENK